MIRSGLHFKLGVLFALFFLSLLPSDLIAASGDSDPRVQQATLELQAAREMLRDVTNETERAILTRRAELAQKEAATARRMVEIEAQQESLDQVRADDIAYSLREKLRSIDIDRDEANDTISRLNQEISKWVQERTELEAALATSPAPGEEEDDKSVTRIDEMQQEIKNLHGQIRVLVAQRDQQDILLRLDQDRQRIEAFITELQGPSQLTLRHLLAKYRYIEDVEKIHESYQALVNRVATQNQDTTEAQELAKARSLNINEEIDLLSDRAAVERKAIGNASREEKEAQRARYNRARKMLSLSMSERKFLKGRLEQLATLEQVWKEALFSAERGADLIDQEILFLRSELNTFQTKFFRMIMAPAAIVLGIILLYFVISQIVFPFWFKRDSLFIARRLGSYVCSFLILIVLAIFFLEDLKAIAAVLGLAGAAIIIALSDLFSSVAGWFVIVISRRVSIGDRVEIDGHRGDVIDVQMLRTTMLELNNWLGVDEPTGRIIAMPNKYIFTQPVFNYSSVHPFVWGKVDVEVTFETPAAEALELLRRILEEETESEFKAAVEEGASEMELRYGAEDMNYYRPRVHSVIAASGVLFSLFYVCHFKKISSTRNKINERIILEFDKDEKMNFAYPTERHIPTPEGMGFPVKMVPPSKG